MQQQERAVFVLTIGLAFAFGFIGVDKYLHPQLWIQWIPSWLDGTLNMTTDMWLKITAGVEIFMAAMILLPMRNVRMAGSVLMVLHMLIVLWHTGLFNDIGARDFGLLAAAVALSALL